MIKYLRRALIRRRARRIRPGGLLPAPWNAWELDDDRMDALRHSVALINQRIAADIQHIARAAEPPREPEEERP